jgi:DNA (cytosine-5)-methyltransferase 1
MRSETIQNLKIKNNTISKNTVFQLGELFCGPGGIALGAVSSKIILNNFNLSIEHVWANDYSEETCQTYRNNICPDKPDSVICKDVRELDITKLPAINAFAYGFPCNDFSIVGEKKGFHGKYGHLYSYGVEVINYFKPLFFIAENVEGLTSVNGGKSFNKILSDLKTAGDGYTLTAHLYKAEEYGVPQTRHRIIIVGFKNSLNKIFKVPAPFTKDDPISARKAIENPPIKKNAHNNEYTAQSHIVVERLKYIKPGDNIWNTELPEELKLNVKGAKLSQIYRRLHPDRPSYTITGSGGGGTHGYHWFENRALTNRERARLQTFPDKFIFEGSKENVRKQIGNAVPPALSKIIFTAILKSLADIPYKFVNASISDEVKQGILF